MNKLTDLELCKRIAEIEGLACHIEQEDRADAYLYSEDTNEEYNPLTDKALLFDLMIKYGITAGRSLDGETHAVWGDQDKAEIMIATDKVPRAILECIVEGNK